MPAPDKFYTQLKERLRGETDRKIQDQLLDLWLATETQATEWDAREWGFDPEKWEAEVRYMIAQLDNKPNKVRRASSE